MKRPNLCIRGIQEKIKKKERGKKKTESIFKGTNGWKPLLI